MRVLRGRIFFNVLDTTYLVPNWDPEQPDTLAGVTERYKVTGALLAASGFDIPDVTTGLLVHAPLGCRELRPGSCRNLPVGLANPQIDPIRTVRHGLGFVPIVWMRNLPGPSATGDPSDGACTFRAAIETQIEMDYQLSQAGRGLKYSSDPTLLIKEPATTDSEIVKGAGNALVVSEKGDAKLLEIGGTASAAVLEYVRTLREFALESIHGNRASADRLTAAQSGRALELMNQGLIWLADNLRISYGEGAMLALAQMVLRAGANLSCSVFGADVAALDPSVRLSLSWPRWVPLTADDRQKDAQTLATLAGAGQISRETAVKSIADTYDIEDVPAELARITAERNRYEEETRCRSRIRPRRLISRPKKSPRYGRGPKSLERQLTEIERVTQVRLIHAELKAEAVRAGMIDLDGLKLIDFSEAKLNERGEVDGAAR